MGGGLMQLVAYGAQDIYLTGNPQITFFKVVYRRHTNFSMEAIQQTWAGTADMGNTATCTVSRNGDLIHRVYVECDGLQSTNKVNNLGSAIIDNVILEIGGQEIDKHYGHWMETWAELTEPNDGGYVNSFTDPDLVEGTRFQNMSGFGGINGSANTFLKAPIFIPLFFWFCRNPGLALPLIALQYHEVKIITKFTSGTNITIGELNLWIDYIYLDTDERRRFAQVSHEYLIEQIQFINSNNKIMHNLNFNHPVKELIWTGQPESPSISTPTELDEQLYHLELNGHQRFAPRYREYFTKLQVWQHHTGFGGLNTSTVGGSNNGIAVYSFALKPEEHQPSGTCNFSRIDNAILISEIPASLNIYAVNYNVLRIMSGMGGLAYSN
ncbi:hypothetical protein N8569_00150 [bacterium]|nr:hypothetical protein [bacterium]